MKFSFLLTTTILTSTLVSSLSTPQLDTRSLSPLHTSIDESRTPSSSSDSPKLSKRKGGGGRGIGGGSSISGGGGRTSGSSGSGTRSGYGSSGNYFSGGSATPYRSGVASPLGLTPFFIAPALLFGLYAGHSIYAPYGAYGYNLPGNATFYNETSGMNQSLPVECYCLRYVECGCDRNTDAGYFSSLVGNGSLEALEENGVAKAVVDDRETLVVNGTLENGTTVAALGAASGLRVGLTGWRGLAGWASTAAVVGWIVAV